MVEEAFQVEAPNFRRLNFFSSKFPLRVKCVRILLSERVGVGGWVFCLFSVGREMLAKKNHYQTLGRFGAA